MVPTLHERCKDNDVNAATTTIYFDNNTTSSLGMIPNNTNSTSSLFRMKLYDKLLAGNISYNSIKEHKEIANQYITCQNDYPKATYELLQKELGIESVNNYNNIIDAIQEALCFISTQEEIRVETTMCNNNNVTSSSFTTLADRFIYTLFKDNISGFHDKFQDYMKEFLPIDVSSVKVVKGINFFNHLVITDILSITESLLFDDFILFHLRDLSHSPSLGTVPDNNNLNSSFIGNDLNVKHLVDNISHNKDNENKEIANQYANCRNDNPTAKDKLQQQELGIELVNDYNNDIDDVKTEFPSASTQEAIGDEKNIQSIYEIEDSNSEQQGNYNNIHYNKYFINTLAILLDANGLLLKLQ